MHTQDGYVSVFLSDRTHRITEFLWLEGTSKGRLVQPHLAQERPLKASCPGLCLDGFEYSRDGDQSLHGPSVP